MVATKNRISAIGGEAPTNGAAETLEASMPYIVSVVLRGVSDMLFHRWNCESVEAKATAAKGSKAKKSDDVESYVYRNDRKELCIPGEYVRQAVLHAAKFKQDPRSPRKSAFDLYKAGVLSVTTLASLGKTNWDYLDKRRVALNKAGITRSRPAITSGWKAEFQLCVNLPEYIPADTLQEVIQNAGRLIGIGDFRPTYGRFVVESFEIMD